MCYNHNDEVILGENNKRGLEILIQFSVWPLTNYTYYIVLSPHTKYVC